VAAVAGGAVGVNYGPGSGATETLAPGAEFGGRGLPFVGLATLLFIFMVEVFSSVHTSDLFIPRTFADQLLTGPFCVCFFLPTCAYSYQPKIWNLKYLYHVTSTSMK